jgi:hypothetical protein
MTSGVDELLQGRGALFGVANHRDLGAAPEAGKTASEVRRDPQAFFRHEFLDPPIGH